MHRWSGLLGWLAVTAAASGISLAAVTLVGSSIGDPVSEPLSAEQVQRRLRLAGGTAEPSREPTTGATSGPTSGPATGGPTDPSGDPTQSETAGPLRLLDSGGGTVLARCTGALVELESWSPADGFWTDDVRAGPATITEIEFESEDDRYRLQISCQAGEPTAEIEHDERGGNSGPGGGDDDNSGPGGGDDGGGSGPG